MVPAISSEETPFKMALSKFVRLPPPSNAMVFGKSIVTMVDTFFPALLPTYTSFSSSGSSFGRLRKMESVCILYFSSGPWFALESSIRSESGSFFRPDTSPAYMAFTAQVM